MGSSQQTWLRAGRRKKLGLDIAHRQLEDAGPFTAGGAKTVWHTTEGGSVASVVQTLASKRAAVHFVIDPKTGETVQCIPLDRAGRGLMHSSGPETNRANCIQVEIVGFAAQSGQWTASMYRHLAALALLIERRHGTPRVVRNFTHPQEFTGTGFVTFAGHCGHCHVPGNDHWDPGAGFKGRVLLKLLEELDRA